MSGPLGLRNLVNRVGTRIMNKALGIALLAAGIVLLVFGISETDSFASHFSRFFTGNPTDKSMCLVLGGVASFLVGAVMMFRPAR